MPWLQIMEANGKSEMNDENELGLSISYPCESVVVVIFIILRQDLSTQCINPHQKGVNSGAH